MPQSRHRHGHHYQKPANVPAKQRVKGRIMWAILFAVFGLLIGFFASDNSYIALAIGALVGGTIGYVAGKSMEREA